MTITTEKDRVNPESTGDTGDLTERYKKLQRELDREKKKNRKALMESLDLNAQFADLSEVKQYTKAIMGALEKSELMDQTLRASLAATRADVERTASEGAVVRQSWRDIQTVLTENEIDWDEDERLSKARQAWDKGDYTVAVEAAKVAAHKEQDISALVEAEVAKRWQNAGKVDTAGSTVGKSVADMTEAELKKTLGGPGGVAFMHDNKEAILRRYHRR